MIKGDRALMNVIIRTMQPEDFEDVAKIYHQGIQTGIATFQTDIPSWEAWDNSHIKTCRLVAVTEEGQIVGWVALSPVSSRCVYGGVAEISVYVDQNFRKKGIGILLLESLISASEEQGFWTLQAGVFAHNSASLNLHLAAGFKKVGVRERIGRTSNGIWQDTVLLERRSKVVGIE